MPRLLHLTDIHLRHHQPGSADQPERRSREMPAVLERLSAMLPTLGVEVIVMSGDLLDVPYGVMRGEAVDGRDHATWLAEVVADSRLLRSWLEDTGLGWVICPGNHDHEGVFRDVFPEAGEKMDVAGLRFFCFWDELDADRQPKRTGPRRALFDRALNDPEHDVPQVHVQHYTVAPPTVGKNGWRYEYKGAEGFKARLEASGRVRAVLSGHYHPGVLVEGGPVLYSGPPAFCEAPYPFRVYDIAAGRGARVEEHAVDR